MRVSMSATGSLMLIYEAPRSAALLPARLDQAGDVTAHGRFADLGARQSELAECAARAARERTAIAQARGIGVARQALQLGLGVEALFHRTRLVANDRLQFLALGGELFH